MQADQFAWLDTIYISMSNWWAMMMVMLFAQFYSNEYSLNAITMWSKQIDFPAMISWSMFIFRISCDLASSWRITYIRWNITDSHNFSMSYDDGNGMDETIVLSSNCTPRTGVARKQNRINDSPSDLVNETKAFPRFICWRCCVVCTFLLPSAFRKNLHNCPFGGHPLWLFFVFGLFILFVYSVIFCYKIKSLSICQQKYKSR